MLLKKFFCNSRLNITFMLHNLIINKKHFKCDDNKMNIIAKVKLFYKNGLVHESLCRLNFSQKLKKHSSIIVRAWIQQCEFIVAQKFRRTQQMFCLYNRLWGEKALKDLLVRMSQQLNRRGKEFIFGAVGISAFNWEKYKISDNDLQKHIHEFDYVKILEKETIVCKKCQQKRIIDIMLPDENYCKCPGTKKIRSYDNWTPFLERKNLLVWRRLLPKGIYEYKLYGKYDDVTAEDFLQVQIDVEFRQKWDTTAVSLFIIETDEKSNSDVIYWEMQWPRMFTNRDYVFHRRFLIDDKHKIITILSKCVEHPDFPPKSDKHRVTDYESCMVIRPLNSTFDNNGIEFSLTYYDDPGISIPAAVTSWVAIAGMPDFLIKLRNAAKKYKRDHGINVSFLPDDEDFLNSIKADSDKKISQLSINSETKSTSYWKYPSPALLFKIQ